MSTRISELAEATSAPDDAVLPIVISGVTKKITRANLALSSGGGMGFRFTYSTTTTDGDPGPGTFRFSNAALANNGTLYVDLLEFGGTSVAAWLDSFDDYAGAIKGVIRLQSRSDSTKWIEYTMTAWTTASGYRKLTVAYKDGPGGLLTTAGDTFFSFDYASNSGASFRGTYHMDPAATATPNGSEGAPYTTFALSKAASAAASPLASLFILPPGVNLTENIVLPATGGSHEIECKADGVGNRAKITGTADCSSATQGVFTFSNIQVTGAITGDSGNLGGNFLVGRDATFDSNVTLSGAAGVWFVDLIGQGTTFFAFGGYIGGNLTITALGAQVFASNWFFNGNVDTGTGPSEFNNCKFANGKTITLQGVLGASLVCCKFGGSVTFAATLPNTSLYVDDATYEEMLRLGCNGFGPGSNIVLKRLGGNLSGRRNVSGPIVASQFNGGTGGAPSPEGTYRNVVIFEVGTAATAASFAVNIHYVDVFGVAQVEPVCVWSTAAVGKYGGELVFRHNGSTPLSYSMTFAGTVGPLDGKLVTIIHRED